MTRGITNNNPCNVRISNANWVGKVTPSTDPDFEQFDSVEHGIRAGAKILANYSRDDGIHTIAAIIQRWAPSVENDTAAYTGDVCRRCGVGPFEPYDVLNASNLAKLVTAVIQHENGSCPYDQPTILAGVQMALA
jgi:hypothetical protein